MDNAWSYIRPETGYKCWKVLYLGTCVRPRRGRLIRGEGIGRSRGLLLPHCLLQEVEVLRLLLEVTRLLLVAAGLVEDSAHSCPDFRLARTCWLTTWVE